MRRNVKIGLARLGALSTLLSVLVVSPAYAQDDVTLSMARERFKEGVAYFDRKDFAKARVAFLQAYALKKHPAVLLNLAQSELRSGHEADAAKHFSQYLREHAEATEAERQGAETGLTAAKALVAEVTLNVDASGAEVFVDGDLEGTTPLPGPIYLPTGTHELVVRKDGKSASTQVSAAAGQASSVSLKLTAPPKKPAAADSTVALDPEQGSPAEPPTRRKPFFSWVASTPGAMVGVGLTGVGLAGGIAFLVSSRSAYDAADSVAAGIEDYAVRVDMKPDGKGACVQPEKWLATLAPYRDNPSLIPAQAAQYHENCKKYQDNVKAGDTYKKIGIVGVAVGGAAAIGTVIYYIVDSKEPASGEPTSAKKALDRVTFVPLYEPGFAGGVVTGSF